MRTASWVMALVVCQTALAAQAAATGEGLAPSAADKAWPQWQTRLAGTDDVRPPTRSVSFGDSGLRSRSVGMLGDYYFSRSTWISHTVGGFRATGAMFFGPRSDDGPGLWQSSRYTLASSGRAAGLVAAPYAGVGYTALSATRVWGVRADLGLMSLRQPAAGGVGRAAGGAVGLDDTSRDSRLSPLVQVGVSYSF